MRISLDASSLQASSGCISVSRDPFQWDYILRLPGFHTPVSTPKYCFSWFVSGMWAGSVKNCGLSYDESNRERHPTSWYSWWYSCFLPPSSLRLICIGSPRISLSYCVLHSHVYLTMTSCLTCRVPFLVSKTFWEVN